MGHKETAQEAVNAIIYKNKSQVSHDDVTALMVAKLGDIYFDASKPVAEIGWMIAEEPDRAYGAIMGLLSLVLQLSVRSGGMQRYIEICNFLTEERAKEHAGGLAGLKW